MRKHLRTKCDCFSNRLTLIGRQFRPRGGRLDVGAIPSREPSASPLGVPDDMPLARPCENMVDELLSICR